MTFIDPLIAGDPVQSPLAVHAVAFAASQLRVADCPGSTELGFTVMVRVAAGGGGGGGGTTLDLPPQPERTKATRQKK